LEWWRASAGEEGTPSGVCDKRGSCLAPTSNQHTSSYGQPHAPRGLISTHRAAPQQRSRRFKRDMTCECPAPQCRLLGGDLLGFLLSSKQPALRSGAVTIVLHPLPCPPPSHSTLAWREQHDGHIHLTSPPGSCVPHLSGHFWPATAPPAWPILTRTPAAARSGCCWIGCICSAWLGHPRTEARGRPGQCWGCEGP
jgi:hypothetical protein